MKTSIILAAGRGARLGDLTVQKPKCLIDVGGEPLISYQLELMKRFGYTKQIVVTGYRSEQVCDEVGDCLTIHNPYWEKNNMVASLFRAIQHIYGTVVISYADIAFSQTVFENLLNQDKNIVVSADLDFLPYWKDRLEEPFSDLESFSTCPSGYLSSIGESVDINSNIEAQYIGLLRFSPTGSKILKEQLIKAKNLENFDQLYMTDLLTNMINDGVQIWPSYHHGGWLEIDTPSDLIVAEKRLSSF